MSAEPLVSVVTPVRNGEAYLGECIESVLAQTHQNWDHTIVDNASTDGTAEIARAYAARDSRIRVRTNPALVPVIQNFNNAFRSISPESRYCKPLAGDDVLLPECLERMVRLAEAHPGVVLVGAYGIYSRADMGTYGHGVPYRREVVPGRELCRAYLMGCGPSVFGAATMLLFRSDLIRRRASFYNEAQLHADSEACLEVLEEGDFGFVHQILTMMRIEEGTISEHSRSLNTKLPFSLYALQRYGPKHLGEAELGARIREELSDYYQYLGWQLFKRRGREFWDFHRAELRRLGCPLSRARLAIHAARYVLGQLLDPGRTAERLVERWRPESPTPR